MSNVTKTPRAPRTRKSVVVDNHAQSVILCATWVDSINARVTVETTRKEGTTDPVSPEWARILKTLQNESFPNALASLMGTGSVDTVEFSRIVGNDSTQAKGTNFVAVKTIEKIVNMVFTLAANDLHKLSDYSSQVLNAALHNGNALSIQGGLASLSKRVSRVDLPNREHITSAGSYTPGTAGAQNAQVRDALRVLGLATTVKGLRGDTMQLNIARVESLRTLYAMSAV